MKKLGLILMIAALVLAVPGCAGIATQNISGRGTVGMVYVIGYEYDEMGKPIPIYGEPGEATFSLNFACYAQNNNRMQGNLTWNDTTNGVKITASLPETSVKSLGIPNITTCKALKAAAATLPFSVNAAGVYSENGNADGDNGTQTGIAAIIVAKPGETPDLSGYSFPYADTIFCGETGTAVAILASTQQIYLYAAVGCLDRGKIIFGSGGQNGQ